jgi:hypothetical protein
VRITLSHALNGVQGRLKPKRIATLCQSFPSAAVQAEMEAKPAAEGRKFVTVADLP